MMALSLYLCTVGRLMSQITGNASFTFPSSQAVYDFCVDIHVNPLHVLCSSPIVGLGEILPQW